MTQNGIGVLVLSGPTASGKTALAVEAAQRLDAEIVNADSMQVYRHMDIGTAKPTVAERGGVPHHLLDVVDPGDPFDAVQFVRLADRCIADIARRNKRVLVVGGTGLYIRALLWGLQQAPPPDPAVRAALTARVAAEGSAALHRELEQVDPECAARLHPNDAVRIVRALEVFAQTGKPLSAWQREHGFASARYRHCYAAVFVPVEELNRRIDARVDAMMARGFLEEVRRLRARGVPADARPMQALGYKWMGAHLDGVCSLEEAVSKTKVDTRRYAKRQRTWLRKERDVHWLEPDCDRLVALARSCGL